MKRDLDHLKMLVLVMSILIMAAPNGARKTKADHPNLPITVAETVAAAAAAHKAGAGMLHAHVRDHDAAHSLDAHRYRDLLDQMAEECPDMPCQITTEAVGKYSPQDQADCLRDVAPDFASIAIQELTGDQSQAAIDFASGVIRDAGQQHTHIQYILYGPEDLSLLRQMRDHGQLGDAPLDALFVLGKYNPGFKSHPDELDPFLQHDLSLLRSWSVCAFGPLEFDVMVKAASKGGHARVGFENNLYLRDGTMATSTAELVAQLAEATEPMENGRMLFTR